MERAWERALERARHDSFGGVRSLRESLKETLRKGLRESSNKKESSLGLDVDLCKWLERNIVREVCRELQRVWKMSEAVRLTLGQL